MKLKKLIIKTSLYITLLATGFLIGIYATISTPGDSYYVKEINSSEMYPKGKYQPKDPCKYWTGQLKKIKIIGNKKFKNKPDISLEKEFSDMACGKLTYLVFTHGQWTVTVRKDQPNRSIIVTDAAGISVGFSDDKLLGKSISIDQKERPLFVEVSDRNKDGYFEYLQYTDYRKNNYIGIFTDYNMDGQIDLRAPGRPINPSVYIDGKWHTFYYTKIKGRQTSYILYKGKRYNVDTRKYPFKLSLIKK